MNRKGNSMGMLALGLLVVIALGLFFGDEIKAAFDGAGDDTASIKGVSLQSDATPDLLINSFDVDNKNTALTESTNIYRLKGTTTWATFTAGTAIADLQPGEQYEVVMGITTSDMTDNSYGRHFTTEALSYSSKVTIEEGLYQDAAETDLSATFKNNDETAAAQTFSAGDTKNVYLKFESPSDKYFGNPNIGDATVLCLNLNSTAWETPEGVYVGSKKLTKVAAPLRHSVDSTHRAHCYAGPVVDSAGVEFRARIEADGSNAPQQDDTAHLYAANFYINEDGMVAEGVEDEDGNVVGTDAADTLTLDFT